MIITEIRTRKDLVELVNDRIPVDVKFAGRLADVPVSHQIDEERVAQIAVELAVVSGQSQHCGIAEI